LYHAIGEWASRSARLHTKVVKSGIGTQISRIRRYFPQKHGRIRVVCVIPCTEKRFFYNRICRRYLRAARRELSSMSSMMSRAFEMPCRPKK
jgi:hypothetical protein